MEKDRRYNKSIMTYVDEDTYNKLLEVCKEYEMKVSAVCRRFIKRGLKNV